MNDASGDHVEDQIEEFEGDGTQLPANHMSNDQAHLDPTRWWFASSAFPMAAGTLGPVASAFSICSLVRPWRQHYLPGSDIQKAPFVGDPKWLDAINGVQLFIALVANLALLLNMTRRVRFAIALPITIVGWYISSICLLALNATAAGPLQLQPAGDYVWSQAFYYGIYAACLYFIVASLMLVTYRGAVAGHYVMDFQLTTSQRTLMLQTIMFLVYLLIGALVFSTTEGWDYLDAVYWADVTLFTVGFGDYYPVTTLGRALLFPYALIGIISLGLVVGSIRSLVLERGRRTLGARMVEKKRRRLVRSLTTKGKDGLLVPIEDKPTMNRASPSSDDRRLTELERREAEFNLMRKVQVKAARRRRWVAMAISTSTWLVLWLVGAKIFENCEKEYQGWSYFDGFYFAFVSLTTIGYGDVTPISPPGKSFFVFWSLLALPTMTVLISNAGDTIVKGIRDATNSLGNITILPGERGFKKDLKEVLRALSCGQLFGDDEEVGESPPGFLGDAPRLQTREEEEEELDDEVESQLEQAEEDEAADVENARAQAQNEKSMGRTPDSTTPTSSNGKPSPARQITFSDATKPSEKAPPLERPPTSHSTASGRSRHTSASNSVTSHRKGSSSSKNENKANNSTDGKSNSQQLLPMLQADTMPRQEFPPLPTNKPDYLVTLIDEIGHVTHHLKSHPPRKYTFKEWAWYLMLIGEDESRAETHRKAVPHVHSRKNKRHGHHGKQDDSADDNEERGNPEIQGDKTVDDNDTKQWSWVGSRSPLMGSQEEAEWILEQLTQRLAAELRDARTEEHNRPKADKGRKSLDHHSKS